MELTVTSLNKGSHSKISVTDAAFACEFNEGLVHQVVVAYMAAGRAGTKAQKTRSDVSGGGKKPWRQKGTGSARAGTTRGPLWRTGGVTFAARPRDYTQKVNRKVYKKALAGIVSELNRQERLIVIDDIQLKEPKTKLLVPVLTKLSVGQVLIAISEENPNLVLAARNIPGVEVKLIDKVSPVDLVGFDKIVITEAAVKKLEERLV